jgi:hypothetical protein
MAARDILTLKTPMAEGIIRLLYTIALILIALGVVMGLARGIRIMSHTPMQPPAITAPATPQSGATTTPPAPQTDAQNAGPGARQGMMGGDFRGWHRHGHYRGYGMMMGRSPVGFGFMVILGSLLRGLIALLLVRVLAEIGLSILGMPKRAA